MPRTRSNDHQGSHGTANKALQQTAAGLSTMTGIYDMHGNVCEWCRDGWQQKLQGGNDPFVAPDESGRRIVRGGWVRYPEIVCQSGFRDSHHAVDRLNFEGDLGLRVALCRVRN